MRIRHTLRGGAIKTVACYLRLACEFNLCIIAMTAATAGCSNLQHAPCHTLQSAPIKCQYQRVIINNNNKNNEIYDWHTMTATERLSDGQNDKVTEWQTERVPVEVHDALVVRRRRLVKRWAEIHCINQFTNYVCDVETCLTCLRLFL